MKLTRVQTGTVWEQAVGYARATRAGGFIAVSATAAADREGRPLACDAYGQTKAIFRQFDEVLGRLGSRRDLILRLRVYHADPAIGEGFARALREEFPDGGPALTAVRVAALVDPALLLEIEADAAVGGWEPEAEARREWDEPVD